ncbi:phage tail tip fiber protein [Enterobacter hormaechei]|uniref:phage tail tip fiber protein n=1 Tax=Enterobacter hormaechei TaxID=158836 RepID=UPI003EB73AA1
MSEPSIVPYVKTTPKPFGVDVEWKWPGGCLWLELQYLHEDGRLVKEIIHWPAINYLISGLKAGERLQLRLRPLPVGQDGSARDWRASDWIEGVSSVDTEEIIEALDEEIRNSCALHGLKGGWTFEKNGVLIINNGEVFVTDAKIDDAVLSKSYSVKLNVAGKGKPHEAGMTLGVEGENSKVEFLADRYKVHEAAQSASNNEKTTFNVGLSFGGFPGAISHDKANPADGNNATKTSLNDEMCEVIISAVRESDLFAALQAKIDAQTASVVGLQQAMHEAVNDALRNALKPGGILWNTRSSGL